MRRSQQGAEVESQEEETKVANLCFMASIASDDEEAKVETFEPKLSYDESSSAYNELK